MRNCRFVALTALCVLSPPALPQDGGALSWHLVDGGNRLVYGPPTGDPAISLGCGPMATVEVWIADPRGLYRAKGLKVVTLTALHGVENRSVRHDTYRSGVDAIVYTVDASSLMWTALLMDRGFGLYNAPQPTRIPGDGASQLVRDFLPRCLSPNGRSRAAVATAATTSGVAGTGASETPVARRQPPVVPSKNEPRSTSVNARQKPSSPGWCWGTFIRRSCMLGGNDCPYPRENGRREEFMGWEDDDGVRGYAVFRLGAYRATDIQLDPGCRLRKH